MAKFISELVLFNAAVSNPEEYQDRILYSASAARLTLAKAWKQKKLLKITTKRELMGKVNVCFSVFHNLAKQWGYQKTCLIT